MFLCIHLYTHSTLPHLVVHMCVIWLVLWQAPQVFATPPPLFPHQFLICLVADFEFILIRFYFLLIFITFSYISFDFALVVSTLNYLLFVFLVARACSMRQKGNKMSKKKKREREKKNRNVYEIYK